MADVPAPKKTRKRETAWVFMAFDLAFFIWGFMADNIEIIEAAKFLSMPATTFLLGAFGMDAYAKQIRPYEGGSAWSSRNFNYPAQTPFVGPVQPRDMY